MSQIPLTAAAAAVAFLPLGGALPPADPVPDPVAYAPYSTDPGWGRPMDDHGGPLYGDLSVFDAITEHGEAQAEDVPYCDQPATLSTVLRDDFGESPRHQTQMPQGRSVSLWASEEMGTWTAVYTRADGISCVISSGIGWQGGTDPIALLREEGLLPQA
ncbi:hypothetical protein [Paenirhodobacter populi]|uniref:Uncharacterized protein n=1 Tax=Paenirhodobacter populi TaxID=2306993 RepID=A0A443J3K3_9RHOB|nr:hypothetical protein [Sinirhodobacter populi]RWR10910.1 hypothetical protein D2T32_03350 [Sinirhodobacter populi]RWR14925.1 hypothetical protein D2T33_02965 [Sinirhodobacter populi]RWR23873.1 hypothetical protein D2T30_01790 [Sinirhodobacter populi]RWR35076.1 hypothetical protein D2T29_00965 [Sinirhodobacter populi]